MENKDILKLLKLATKLLDLHDHNQFKIRAYQSATNNLDKSQIKLGELSLSELEKVPNVGKSIALAIHEISSKGTFAELDNLVINTPKGVIEMLEIKGIGPKKIRSIWKELAIETLEGLKQACIDGHISKLKGFGDKLQEEVLEFLYFKEESKGKYFYSDVEQLALSFEGELKDMLNGDKVSLSGEVRQMMEIVETIQYIIGTDNKALAFEKLNLMPALQQDLTISSPFIWRGTFTNAEIKVEIKLYPKADFASQLYLHSAGKQHLSNLLESEINPFAEKTLFQILKNNKFESEKDLFAKLNWPEVPSECREGYFEFEAIKSNSFSDLIKDTDLKGIFHNHSTYSDGEHTLTEMAEYCKSLGYEYLGISDHSKTANYANGLREDAIVKQHLEIDELNKKLAPFKIFKGIESDILGDGSLDYEPEVLKTFDFIVASIHANLKMDIEKATTRLIRAIENPYTTMLGHPTGRLLLRRQGYPIDHAKVIDACADNGVIIEINANPWRLDLDWRWVNYAINRNVMLSINPDAHEMEGYLDMHYGVCVGRKGGLTKQMTFNSKSLSEVELYLSKK